MLQHLFMSDLSDLRTKGHKVLVPLDLPVHLEELLFIPIHQPVKPQIGPKGQVKAMAAILLSSFRQSHAGRHPTGHPHPHRAPSHGLIGHIIPRSQDGCKWPEARLRTYRTYRGREERPFIGTR